MPEPSENAPPTPETNEDLRFSAQANGEPFEVAVLALQNLTLFPETVVPLGIGRPRSIAAVESALSTPEKLLACITVRPDRSDDTDATSADIYEVGTLTMIKRMERTGEGIRIIVQGTERIRVAHASLVREVEIRQLRSKIASEAQTEMDKAQRDYVLRQQMRAIQKELGEDETGEAAETELLRERLEKAELPEEVRAEADRELKRLQRLPPAAPDYHVIRTYLEFVLELPWRKSSEDKLDLAEARRILDEDHYGLEDVKERILEFLAVIKLRPDTKSPILLFVGPPGVGKTSLGRSIARALGRQFERMSLGGVRDEAELRGHRRTYIGAMPGRIIQSIRRAA